MYNGQGYMSKFEIISIIGTFFIVIFTAITAFIKIIQAKNTRPIITLIENLSGGKFKIIVVNNRPYKVVIQNIYYRIKRWIIWSKKKNFSDIRDDSIHAIPFIFTHSITYIEKQAILFITVPKYAKEKVYKLVLNTTAGCVKTILPESRLKVESDNQVK